MYAFDSEIEEEQYRRVRMPIGYNIPFGGIIIMGITLFVHLCFCFKERNFEFVGPQLVVNR